MKIDKRHSRQGQKIRSGKTKRYTHSNWPGYMLFPVLHIIPNRIFSLILALILAGAALFCFSCTGPEQKSSRPVRCSIELNPGRFDIISIEDEDTLYQVRIKKGDVILRPFLPKQFFSKQCLLKLRDIFIDLLIPGRFEHAEIYLGNGEVLDIMPESYIPVEYKEQNSIIVKKPVLEEFQKVDYFPGKSPDRIFTVIRITGSTKIIDKAISWLIKSSTLDITFNGTGIGKVIKKEAGMTYYDSLNCISGITRAYIEAGYPAADLEVTSWQNRLNFSGYFQTGYDLYKTKEAESTWTKKKLHPE